MLDNPFNEKMFLDIPSKPSLAQLKAVSSRPITCYLGKETDTHLAACLTEVDTEVLIICVA